MQYFSITIIRLYYIAKLKLIWHITHGQDKTLFFSNFFFSLEQSQIIIIITVVATIIRCNRFCYRYYYKCFYCRSRTSLLLKSEHPFNFVLFPFFVFEETTIQISSTAFLCYPCHCASCFFHSLIKSFSFSLSIYLEVIWL